MCSLAVSSSVACRRLLIWAVSRFTLSGDLRTHGTIVTVDFAFGAPLHHPFLPVVQTLQECRTAYAEVKERMGILSENMELLALQVGKGVHAVDCQAFPHAALFTE